MHKRLTGFHLVVVALFFIFSSSCGIGNIGGAGWDTQSDKDSARNYPTIVSNRIRLTSEEVSYGTFEQKFTSVFEDFRYHGEPVPSSESINTQISGTPYSVSYKDFVLKVYRAESAILERKLPSVFYMHPVSSAVIPGKSPADDRILCRTNSRATTGLHYILIADGNGEILFEKVVTAAEDWDILLGESGEIIIGGSHTKTVIALNK
ncbi:MAG: hypothetical protein K1X52_11125 [Pyrinomonadaceae bacterium]|nr:hypothetical protein [Pyrinomonadaceae bacterium]